MAAAASTRAGTTESVGALQAEQMRRYHREHYQAGNIVLADHGRSLAAQLEGMVERQEADRGQVIHLVRFHLLHARHQRRLIQQVA